MKSDAVGTPLPSLVDRSFQVAYVVAYRLMRAYWAIRRPDRHGALVALFHDGELLLVRNSYVPYYSLPGGYVRRGETARQAAIRELAEEVGVKARADALVPCLDERSEWEGKRDRVEIFALEAPDRPTVRIDNREVVAAEWLAPERAVALNLFPPIRRLLARRIRGTGRSRDEVIGEPGARGERASDP